MTISYLKLKKIAFFCLALPSVIFVLGFLKWYIGIPVALLMAVAYFFAVRTVRCEEDQTLHLPVPFLLAVVGIVTLWCYFGGIGNLYYQSEDWSARNAIFRDLIRFEWPVIYPAKNAALVYYIAYWMPPAVVGKAFLAMTGGNLTVAWWAGNAAMWLWSVICVTLVILLVMIYVKANTKKRFWLVLLIIITFSGLDIVGTVFNRLTRGILISNHIEWWSRFQFSSLTTCLFWVFNQSVFGWLATACFLFEKKVCNYAFIIVCALPSSPFACIGLGIYMVGKALLLLVEAIREKRVGRFWRDVFTPQNVIPVLTVLPIIFFYFITNVAFNMTSETVATVAEPRAWSAIALLAVLGVGFGLLGYRQRRKLRALTANKLFFLAIFSILLCVLALVNVRVRMNYLWFILLESIVFLLVLWDDHKKDPIFYLSWLVTVICPLLQIGTAEDFCMRASIPLIFILMVMCIQYLFQNAQVLKEKRVTYAKACYVVLVVLLVLGSVTVYKEFERGIVHVVTNGKINLVNDSIYSFERLLEGGPGGADKNFIAVSYQDTFFFRYLAK